MLFKYCILILFSSLHCGKPEDDNKYHRITKNRIAGLDASLERHIKYCEESGIPYLPEKDAFVRANRLSREEAIAEDAQIKAWSARFDWPLESKRDLHTAPVFSSRETNIDSFTSALFVAGVFGVVMVAGIMLIDYWAHRVSKRGKGELYFTERV